MFGNTVQITFHEILNIFFIKYNLFFYIFRLFWYVDVKNNIFKNNIIIIYF